MRDTVRAVARPIVSAALALTLVGGLIALDGGAPATFAASSLAASALKTDSAVNPLGITSLKPSFSWQLESAERDVMQASYELRVATTADDLGSNDVWNSGVVNSDASIEVSYDGSALDPATRYFWQVRVTNNNGETSGWSEAAWFETALAETGAWGSAEWISVAAPAAWSDFDVSLDYTMKPGTAFGVYLRSSDNLSNGYMWQLNDMTAGTPKLRPHKRTNGSFAVMGEVVLPAELGADVLKSRGTLRIVAKGNTITTSVNGVKVDERNDASFGSGRFGIRTNGAELVTLHSVQATAGTETLLDSDLVNGANPFTGGTSIPGSGVQFTGDLESVVRSASSSPMMRDEFAITKPVTSARLYASSQGVYEFSLNGERISDIELAPGFTDYNLRTQYQSYDVTDQLEQGDNAIGVLAGPGWYAGNLAWFGPNQYGAKPSVIGQLVVDYEDGTSETFGTDASWKSAQSPIVASDLLSGESYDARLEQDGWDTASFTPSGWTPVEVTDTDASDTLVPQVDPPVRVTGEINSLSVTEPTAGRYVFDLGQNMVGKVRLQLEGVAGQTVTLRHAEVVHADGTIAPENLRSAKATDTYTFAEDGMIVYEPRFTFHGFRYVELSGLTAAPATATVTGLVMNSDAPFTSTFETSDPMVNQLQNNIVWGQRGNWLSIPTDTPARDERLGWTGDINVFASTAVFNMDSLSFLRKWMVDMRDAQRADGAYPEVAPQFCKNPAVHSSCGAGSTGWADAGITVPWTLWNAYGDTAIIRENYASMQQYIDYLTGISPAFIRPNAGTWGDWLNLGDNVPGDVLGTAFYAHSVNLMSQMARAIGNTADADAYDSQFASIRDAFNAKFVSADGTVKGGSQTGYSIAIEFGLIPDALLAKAGEKLAANVAAKGGHLATGFLGTPSLLPALTASGQSDVAYQLLLNRSYPSWGFQIDRGATTMWERWDSIKEDGSYGDIGMNSFNHYAYGAVGNWMYTTIGGLAANEPGYKKFTVAPQPGGGLSFANTSLDSRYGEIVSNWKKTGDNFALDMTVPANTTATVKIPAQSLASILEGGAPADGIAGIHSMTFANGVATLTVGSGNYAFTADASVGQLSDLEKAVVAYGVSIQELADEAALTGPQTETLQARQSDLLDAVRAANTAYLAGDTAATIAAVHDGLAELAKIDAYLADQKDKDALDPRADALATDSAALAATLSQLSARLLGITAHIVPGADGILPGASVAASVVVDNAGTSTVTAVDATLVQPKNWKLTADSDTPVASLAPTKSGTIGFSGSVPVDAGPGTVTIAGTATYSFGGSAATIPVTSSVVVASPVTFGTITSDPATVGPEQQFVVKATVVNNSDLTVAGTVNAAVPAGWMPARSEQIATIAPRESRVYTLKLTAPYAVEGSSASLGLSFVNGPVTYASTTTKVMTSVPAFSATEIDHIDLGNVASETAHNLTASAKSGITPNEAGLTRRYTDRSDATGYFEFTATAPKGQPFVIKGLETYDRAQTKEYNILVNGELVLHRVNKATGGGTQAFDVLVSDTALSATGEVTIRFQKVGNNYDPSIADVWITSAYDHVDLGNVASETAHGLTASAKSGISPDEAGLTRRYTHREDPDGFMQFTVGVAPGEPFVVRAIETYDQAQIKEYDITVNGVVVKKRYFTHTGGLGTESYQFVVDDPAISATGKVTLRFQKVGDNYDPSIADVWVFDAPGDDIAPVVTAALKPLEARGLNGWFTGPAEVTLVGHDDHPGAVGIEQKVGDGAWSTYSAPITFSDEGTTQLSYRGTDLADNVGEVDSREVKIDSIAPATTATVSPKSGKATTADPAVVTLKATDASSGVASTSYSVDNGVWVAWNGTGIPLSELGGHTVRFQSTDVAGNVESVKSVAVTVIAPAPVDKTAPAVSLGISHPGTSGWYMFGAEATLTASDAGSGVASVQYSLNGAAWLTYTDSIVLPDGSYTLRFRATDGAGNVSSIGSKQVKVDSIAPSVWGWVPMQNRVSIVGSDAASGLARVEYSLDDGASWLSNLTAVVDADKAPTSLQLRGVDLAGNVSAVQTIERSDVPSQLTLKPGQRLFVEASGFTAGAHVNVELHSAPAVIAKVVANDSGVIVANGVVPAGPAAGTHTLVLVVATDGGGTAPGTSTGGGSITIPATVIASTGSEISPWLLASLLLLVGGGGVFLVARRRSTAHTASIVTTLKNG